MIIGVQLSLGYSVFSRGLMPEPGGLPSLKLTMMVVASVR